MTVVPQDPIYCSMPGFPVPHHLPEFAKCMSFASVMPHNHLILHCRLLFLSSVFLSTRVFSFNFVYYFKSESASHSVVSDSLQPHGPYGPQDSSGQNTEVGSLSLLQGILPTQGLNPDLPHCRQILYRLSHKGSPSQRKWVKVTFI